MQFGNLKFITNSTVKLQEGVAFLRGKVPIRAATQWCDKMDSVKKSVGFPFSCGQCHSRTRQELIKDQKNNTVIEKGCYVTQSHPGLYHVPEKHTTLDLIRTLRVQGADEWREYRRLGGVRCAHTTKPSNTSSHGIT